MSYAKALYLWCRYNETTEQFDEKICTGPRRDGLAMPGSPEEHRAINANARVESEKMRAEMAELRIDGADISAARRDAFKMTRSEWRRTIERYEERQGKLDPINRNGGGESV